jgi:Zn-dependent protease
MKILLALDDSRFSVAAVSLLIAEAKTKGGLGCRQPIGGAYPSPVNLEVNTDPRNAGPAFSTSLFSLPALGRRFVGHWYL